MKKMNLTTVLFLVLTASACFAQKENPETLTVPLSQPGKSYTLKADLVTGSINVTGYDGKDVIVNVTSRKDSVDEDNDMDHQPKEKGMRRITTRNGYEVTAKEADNNITINTGNPNSYIDLNIKAPQNVKLKLTTVNEGVITVSGLKGEIEVQNVNNDINLKNISGSAVANTVNGEITAVFSSIEPQASMGFSTLNGDINVTFPSDTRADLKLKSDMGDVYSDFDIDVDKRPAKTEQTSEPGLYKIKKDDWVYGKINGGGPEMIFKSMHGDIYIKKAAK